MVIHKAHTSRIRQSMGDNLFDVVVNVVAVLVMLLVLIPLIFVVAASFSDPDRVLRGEGEAVTSPAQWDALCEGGAVTLEWVRQCFWGTEPCHVEAGG